LCRDPWLFVKPRFFFFKIDVASWNLNTPLFSGSAENEPHEGKRRNESIWPIIRIHHQRSRYVYDMYYKKKAISKELYEYCLAEKIADANLIAKWKKVIIHKYEIFISGEKNFRF